jgi:hypothetical protein
VAALDLTKSLLRALAAIITTSAPVADIIDFLQMWRWPSGDQLDVHMQADAAEFFAALLDANPHAAALFRMATRRTIVAPDFRQEVRRRQYI